MIPTYDDIESTAMRALFQHGTLISRRTLERRVVGAGATPSQFTNAVDRLVKSERIHLTPISVPNCPDCKFFSLSAPMPREIAEAKAIYAERLASFNGKTLGSIGEQYARALFAKARKRGASWFRNIPRKKRLGHLPLPGDAGEADLIIDLDTRAFDAKALLVEVKNAFEAYAVGNPVFSKLLRQALAAKMQPALITPRISPDAALFCREIGIALLLIDRQIVPNDLMPAARNCGD